MNFAARVQTGTLVSRNEEFSIQNEEICIKIEEFSIQNEKICIQISELFRCRGGTSHLRSRFSTQPRFCTLICTLTPGNMYT